MDSAQGPMEAGVAEREDPAVRGDQPVTAAVRSGGHPDDRIVQSCAHRAVGHGPTECPHAAISAGLPPTLRRAEIDARGGCRCPLVGTTVGGSTTTDLHTATAHHQSHEDRGNDTDVCDPAGIAKRSPEPSPQQWFRSRLGRLETSHLRVIDSPRSILEAQHHSGSRFRTYRQETVPPLTGYAEGSQWQYPLMSLEEVARGCHIPAGSISYSALGTRQPRCSRSPALGHGVHTQGVHRPPPSALRSVARPRHRSGVPSAVSCAPQPVRSPDHLHGVHRRRAPGPLVVRGQSQASQDRPAEVGECHRRPRYCRPGRTVGRGVGRERVARPCHL